MDIGTIEMLMLHYASGSLGPAEALIAATHASLNQKARKMVDRFEALGGEIVNETEPAALSENCLQSVLQKITQERQAAESKPAMDTGPLADVPCAMKKLLLGGCTAQQKKWRHISAEQMEITLHVTSGLKCPQKLRLIRMTPAAAVRITNAGRIIIVIMAGTASSQSGLHGVGDILISAPTQTPRAEISLQTGADGCTLLTLTDPPRFWWQRLF